MQCNAENGLLLLVRIIVSLPNESDAAIPLTIEGEINTEFR